MSNFWGSATETTGEFDSGGGAFGVIPEGTSVLAAISEAEWTEHNGEEYINFKWSVLQPESLKNRKVFQKLRILDNDEKKADKARRMFAAIDKNASGGKIIAMGKQPTDADMMRHLVGKPMVLRIGVWELDGKKGNWIQAVAPKTGAAKIQEPPKQDQSRAQSRTAAPRINVGLALDDDVPF